MAFPSVCLRCKPATASKVTFHGVEPLNNPAKSLSTRKPTVALSDEQFGGGRGISVGKEVQVKCAKREQRARENKSVIMEFYFCIMHWLHWRKPMC